MRPAVLILSGLDPSGGAGVAADILAVQAQGAHALPVVTALTVQDNNRAYGVEPVAPELIAHQVRTLAAAMPFAAVKLGIPGSVENANTIAALIGELRSEAPDLPVVLDPVLSSGRGDALARDNALAAARQLLSVASIVLPNGPEAAALGLPVPGQPGPDILLTGGHGDGDDVVNTWYGAHGVRNWTWLRLAGEFHGSGCTLAASLAARLALGEPMETALENAQVFTFDCLARAYAVAPGQLIPERLTAHR